ncbi:hypothetical protein KAU04_05305, partial [bacterium]|nr:hypothetical protein [bacterium]
MLAARKTAGLEDHARTLGFSKTVPGQLNYQGYLADAVDSSAVTSTLEMTFRLFDSQTKGAELWSETHPAVEVSNGLFHVLLGSVTSFPGDMFDGTTLWLQTEVGAELLTPRKPLVSVAYSQRTQEADHAVHADTAAYTQVAGMTIADSAVVADNTHQLEGENLLDLDNRYVNEEDLDHLDAADGDPANAVCVDAAGKVGIGTTSPLTELDVNGSVNATTYFGDGSNLTGISGTPDGDWTINGNDIYHETGNVGIGTTTPTHPLDVNGNVNATAYYGDGSNLTGIAGTTDNDWTISGNDIYSALPGNVGIGTSSPAEKLAVSGNIHASGTLKSGSSITIDGGSDQITSSGDLEVHVNSGRALKLEPNATSPNLIGGYSGNSVTPGVYGATIGGGGENSYLNTVTDNLGTVGGGSLNQAGDNAGGALDAHLATVAGGYGNKASAIAATVGGGNVNYASGNFATIGGGNHNNASDLNAIVGGGRFNTASDSFATVGGGRYNTAGGSYSVVSGGGGPAWIDSNAAQGDYSVVPGGRGNPAAGDYSFAAGRRAKATHSGTFVWADDTDLDFGSSMQNEFKVRASNGMTVISANTGYGGNFNNQNGGGDGLRAYADVSSGNTWGALYAINLGTSPAIYASAATAGYFSGNVTVTGTLSKGGGSFKIDHPLDPANKYLYHSFVESPDMKNLYDGVVNLDNDGAAWVELPEWFEALNKDFRYQLTPIGAPGPNLYIAQEIQNNRFQIAGGPLGMKVSWQVTGIRH